MSPSYVKKSGNWNRITGVYQKMAGTWRQVELIKVKIAGNWEAVYINRMPEGVVMLMQGTNPSAASGWVLSNGSNGTPNLTDGRYVRIGSSPLATGGSSTHTHVMTSASKVAAHSNHAGNDQKNPTHSHMTTSTHRHTMGHTHTSPNTPSKITYRPYYNGKYIPANSVFLWVDVAYPTFSGITQQHGTLLYHLLNLASTYQIWYATEHKDTYSGYSGYVDVPLVNTSRDYGTSSSDYGQHRHVITHTHSAIPLEKSLPLSRGIKMFKTSSDMFEIPPGVCFLYTKTGAVPQGYTELTATWGARFMAIKYGTSNINTLMGHSYHTVPSQSFTTGYMSNSTRTHGLQENDRYVVPNHTHSMTHGHSTSTDGNNTPLYRQFRLIRKD